MTRHLRRARGTGSNCAAYASSPPTALFRKKRCNHNRSRWTWSYWLTFDRAGRSDALAETVDYGALCEAVRSVMEGPHASLLEHLAEEVADRALAVAAGQRVACRRRRPKASSSRTSRHRVGRGAYNPPVTTPSPTPRRTFVALGSNVGDRWAYLGGGLAQLPDVVAVSRVYETEPVGGPSGQDRYLNMVAELRTSAAPLELLAAAQRAEALAGRARTVRWGPRSLDVDILLIGDLVVDVPGLQVPHPRMWERGFVLVPLADLAPEIVGDRLDEDMRAGVALAGTLGPGQPWPGQNCEDQAGQVQAGQGQAGQDLG